LPDKIYRALDDENAREELKEFDQLLLEHRKGTVFVGLREGQFWKFKCSYKYLHGEVDRYEYVLQIIPNWRRISDTIPNPSTKRTPSWTDRVLYATHTDCPDTLDKSNITNLLYTSIPSYTTSDHVRMISTCPSQNL